MTDNVKMRSLIAAGESHAVELKRQWYDLKTPEGKGNFVKDFLALANAAQPDEDSYLILGVDDNRAIVGVEESPPPEMVAQILSTHTQPVAQYNRTQFKLDGCAIDVITLRHSERRPHYATRDIPRVLISNVIYSRSGPINRILTFPEVELMIRSKSGMPPPLLSSPIVSGFIDTPDLSGYDEIVGRIVNTAGEPVEVHTNWHVSWAVDPRAVHRSGGVHRVTLHPGESVEDSMGLSHVHYYINGAPVGRDQRTTDRYHDVKWTVFYRNRHGVLVPTEHFIRVGR